MPCPACGSPSVAFVVPDAYRACVPGSHGTVSLCTTCLSLDPVEEAPPDPAFDALGTAFPDDPEVAIPLALLVGLLGNLATYRAEITQLLEAVERAGVDPLLVLDRLAAEPSIETDVDLARRRHQLEQLL